MRGVAQRTCDRVEGAKGGTPVSGSSITGTYVLPSAGALCTQRTTLTTSCSRT